MAACRPSQRLAIQALSRLLRAKAARLLQRRMPPLICPWAVAGKLLGLGDVVCV